MKKKSFLIVIYLFLSISLYADSSSLELFYFYDETCGICHEIRDQLFPSVEKELSVKLNVHDVDIEVGDNLEKLLVLERKLKKTGNEFPVVIIGTNYLSGEKRIRTSLKETVSRLLTTGSLIDKSGGKLSKVNNFDESQVLVRDKITKTELLGVLSPWPVFISGLVDGVNPCAFATLIFLLSYLFFVKMERRMVLRMGISYTLGVFLCYFLVGLGALNLLKVFSGFPIVALSIKWVSVGLVSFFLILTIVDIFSFIKTGKSDFFLQLPDKIKKAIHLNIRKQVSPGISLLSSFFLGAVIAFFELACTGQIYLPTIIYILKDPELKFFGVSYLLLYNLAFIIPLVLVFLLAWLGMDKGRIEKVFKKNLLVLKILLAAVFLLLMIYLIL